MNIIHLIYDIFYPKKCLKCGSYGDFVCSKCFEKIELFMTDTCFVCGKISDNARICPNCRKTHDLSMNSLIVSTHYDDLPAKMIESIKYYGYKDLAEYLGEILVRRMLFSKFDFRKYVITAAPLHISRKNERGFNQSELIARYVAGRMGLKYSELLIKNKKTVRQVGLTREKRLENVQGVFEAKNRINDKNILLIDDVVTTGATLSECAKALKDAGAKKVVGLVVARNI